MFLLVFQTLEYAIIIIFIAKDRLSFNNEKDACSETNNLLFNFCNVNGYVSQETVILFFLSVSRLLKETTVKPVLRVT